MSVNRERFYWKSFIGMNIEEFYFYGKSVIESTDWLTDFSLKTSIFAWIINLIYSLIYPYNRPGIMVDSWLGGSSYQILRPRTSTF